MCMTGTWAHVHDWHVAVLLFTAVGAFIQMATLNLWQRRLAAANSPWLWEPPVSTSCRSAVDWNLRRKS